MEETKYKIPNSLTDFREKWFDFYSSEPLHSKNEMISKNVDFSLWGKQFGWTKIALFSDFSPLWNHMSEKEVLWVTKSPIDFIN